MKTSMTSVLIMMTIALLMMVSISDGRTDPWAVNEDQVLNAVKKHFQGVSVQRKTPPLPEGRDTKASEDDIVVFSKILFDSLVHAMRNSESGYYIDLVQKNINEYFKFKKTVDATNTAEAIYNEIVNNGK